MSLEAAGQFIAAIQSDKKALEHIETIKGDHGTVLSEIAIYAKGLGYQFTSDEFDAEVREFIFNKVRNDDVTLDQYKRASKYVMGTGSIICCCSHWTQTM